MKIKEIDRTNIRLLRERIESLLAPLAKETGLSIQAGGARFTSSSFTLKLECAVVTGGVVQDKDRQNFDTYHTVFRLPSDLLDSEFHFRGRTYTVCGLAPNSHRFPVLASRDDGKKFKFPVTQFVK